MGAKREGRERCEGKRGRERLKGARVGVLTAMGKERGGGRRLQERERVVGWREERREG